jgi:DNA polymerase V
MLRKPQKKGETMTTYANKLSLIHTFNPFAHFKKEVAGIYQRISSRSAFIPLYGYKKQSMSVDVVEANLSADQYLVENPFNTYFVKVKGKAMEPSGIYENDILVVDRTMEPKVGQTVLAEINGEYMVRQLLNDGLLASNPNYPMHLFTNIEQFAIIGVVTGSMRKFK